MSENVHLDTLDMKQDNEQKEEHKVLIMCVRCAMQGSLAGECPFCHGEVYGDAVFVTMVVLRLLVMSVKVRNIFILLQ